MKLRRSGLGTCQQGNPDTDPGLKHRRTCRPGSLSRHSGPGQGCRLLEHKARSEWRPRRSKKHLQDMESTQSKQGRQRRSQQCSSGIRLDRESPVKCQLDTACTKSCRFRLGKYPVHSRYKTTIQGLTMRRTFRQHRQGRQWMQWWQCTKGLSTGCKSEHWSCY